ncbi:menaquinone-dependent protoporphyrinogen IX dehydrogenase [Flavobacteriaceae bacterium Ap0902]|nr:menaquinone-dependent protoporphyrinogen IX dehydrogenase [Flavobacteriaceae bacterium Ap0902]
MKHTIGIIYSTVDGHTHKICKHLHKQFQNAQIESELYAIEAFNQDISSFNTIIIGASVRYGYHNKNVIEFINTNKENLNQIKTAFLSVNLVVRKPEKNSPETNPYFIKFMNKIDCKRDFIDVFAGKLYYPAYPFFDKLMIKLIMVITKGSTDTKTPIEYTNWDRVNSFGNKIIKNIQSPTKK